MRNREAETCIKILRYCSPTNSARPSDSKKNWTSIVNGIKLRDREYVNDCIKRLHKQKILTKETSKLHKQEKLFGLSHGGLVLLRDIANIEQSVSAYNEFMGVLIESFKDISFRDDSQRTAISSILLNRGFPKEQAEHWRENYKSYLDASSFCEEIILGLVTSQFIMTYGAFTYSSLARSIISFVFVNEVFQMVHPTKVEGDEEYRKLIIASDARHKVLSLTFLADVIPMIQKSGIFANPAFANHASSMVHAIDALSFSNQSFRNDKTSILKKWLAEARSPLEKEKVAELLNKN